MKEAIWMKPKLRMPTGRVNKDINEYIDRIYKTNKNLIDGAVNRVNEVYAGYGYGIDIVPDKWFKETVKRYMKQEKSTVKEAVEMIGRGTDFLSPEERGLNNIVKAIRNEGNFKRFRKLLKYQEIDWNKLEVDPNNKRAYIYGGNLVIEAPDGSRYGQLSFYIK